MRVGRTLVLLSLLGLISVSSVWACGSTQVCSDTNTSLHATIIVSDVQIQWSTDDEDSSITNYVIRRYNCGNPNNCSTFVANVQPAGSCGTNHNYSYTDTPPGPVGQWIYTVEVWRVTATRACAFDVTPQ